MEQIQDGTGRGYLAKVDSENRLHTQTVNIAKEENASLDGLAYNLNTGIITLTNASTKNAVMYIKNNEDYDMVIVQLIYQTGASTGGSGDVLVDVVRDPTSGTIVSGATAVEISANRNFGSSRVISATAYKGGTGLTLTDGTKFFETIMSTATQRVAIVAGAIVLPKGSSIGINITTPAGNTSMAVEFVVACYLNTTL